jgi:hypothetical protein
LGIATILGLDVARKDSGLRPPAKWKKYQINLFPWQLRGQIQSGMRRAPLCRSLPCMQVALRPTSGNREFRMDVSNTTPGTKK